MSKRPKRTRRTKNGKRQKWFLREWRLYRGLTQSQLGKLVGVVRSDISTWENKRRYHQDLLERLAPALKLREPAMLVLCNPDEGGWMLRWADASDEERTEFVRVWTMMMGPDHAKPKPVQEGTKPRVVRRRCVE